MIFESNLSNDEFWSISGLLPVTHSEILPVGKINSLATP